MDPREIPEKIIARYATRGPRYTSYPTAPNFRAEFDREELESLWRAPRGDGLSLYLHIPYCRQRCLYCGCHTEVLGADAGQRTDRYVDDLLREAAIAAELLGDATGPVMQLALGGGTPNVLTPAEMDRLLDGLQGHWARGDGAEVSAELDPRTATAPIVELLLERGFNRFSLGIQDLDPDVQALIGRVQPRALIEELVGRLRDGSGAAPSINFDLIHGLPGQTPSSFRRTVEQVVEIHPERIAVFGYAHVPWMRPHQQALEGHPMPGPGERIELMGIAWEILTDAGYTPIGFDHFAVAGDELTTALGAGTLHRNFMGYTTRRGLDLVGLGVSAISAVGHSYAQDHKEQDPWRGDLDGERLPWERALVLSEEDLLRREVILDLSCNLRLDLGAFRDRHGFDIRDYFPEEMEQLGPLADDGLLEFSDHRIKITPRGRFLVRNICMVFDEYLGQNGGPQTRYSRTV